jgi:hypothetical protein
MRFTIIFSLFLIVLVDSNVQILREFENQFYSLGSDLFHDNKHNNDVRKVDNVHIIHLNYDPTINHNYQSQNQYHNQQNNNNRISPSSSSSSSSSSCNEYFSYERDFRGFSGKLSIPAWNPSKSVIKAVFTVATRVFVSLFDLHYSNFTQIKLLI